MLVGAMLLTPLVSPLVMAKGVYQSGPDFIAQTFAPETPKPGVLWLTAEIRQQAQNILDRPVAGLRVRYHMAGSKTAWILEEIGKEMPITIGIVIQKQSENYKNLVICWIHFLSLWRSPCASWEPSSAFRGCLGWLWNPENLKTECFLSTHLFH